MAVIFTALYLSSVLITVTQDGGLVMEGAVLPTLIFSIVWYAQFLGALFRFWPRRCPRCRTRLNLAASEGNTLAKLLSRYTSILTSDLWFCSNCIFAETDFQNARSCGRCGDGTCTLKTLRIISSPTLNTFGIVRLSSQCNSCRAHYSGRAIIAPLGSGKDRNERDRQALMLLDRIVIQQKPQA